MKLYLLGKTELHDESGSRLALPTKKVFLLLAMLCLGEGEGLTRSELRQAIWPNTPVEASRSSLRNALALLRRVIGESAIRSEGDVLWLMENTVECDAQRLATWHDYAGDFMPGYSDEWVLDQRLRIRALAVQMAVSDAELLIIKGEPELALSTLVTACEIDPLEESAARLRVELLESVGKHSDAVRLASTFQTRVFRELGVICEIEPTPPLAEANPLMTTGEWLLDRDPDEALSFLAATRHSWLGLDGELALDMHEKVLGATKRPSPTRSLVEAQRLYLMWVVGRFDESFKETKLALEAALQQSEPKAAATLSAALCFGLLSQGKYSQALEQARTMYELNMMQTDPLERLRAEAHLSIIEQHVGHYEAGAARVLNAQVLVEEEGSAGDIAAFNLRLANVHIRDGKLDLVSDLLSSAQRFFKSSGNRRVTGFILLAKAELCESAGEYEKAIAALDEARSLGLGVMGHSLASYVDDITGRLQSKLGEHALAAESIARSTLLRRRLGSTLSVCERDLMTPTHQVLRDKLDEREIRAAFGRAKLSFAQPRA